MKIIKNEVAHTNTQMPPALADSLRGCRTASESQKRPPRTSRPPPSAPSRRLPEAQSEFAMLQTALDRLLRTSTTVPLRSLASDLLENQVHPLVPGRLPDGQPIQSRKRIFESVGRNVHVPTDRSPDAALTGATRVEPSLILQRYGGLYHPHRATSRLYPELPTPLSPELPPRTPELSEGRH